MNNEQIIQEATEAIEKNLNAGCYVEDLLRIVKEKQAEIERLQKENKEQKLILEAINDEINPLPFETDFDKAMKTAKSEAYREFAKEFVDDLSHMLIYDKDYIKAKIFKLLESKQKELTESNE